MPATGANMGGDGGVAAVASSDENGGGSVNKLPSSSGTASSNGTGNSGRTTAEFGMFKRWLTPQTCLLCDRRRKSYLDAGHETTTTTTTSDNKNPSSRSSNLYLKVPCWICNRCKGANEVDIGTLDNVEQFHLSNILGCHSTKPNDLFDLSSSIQSSEHNEEEDLEEEEEDHPEDIEIDGIDEDPHSSSASTSLNNPYHWRDDCSISSINGTAVPPLLTGPPSPNQHKEQKNVERRTAAEMKTELVNENGGIKGSSGINDRSSSSSSSQCHCASCKCLKGLEQISKESADNLNMYWQEVKESVKRIYSQSKEPIPQHFRLREYVIKLCASDPHLLFRRLEALATEHVFDVKAKLLRKLTSCSVRSKTPSFCHDFVELLIREFQSISECAVTISDFIKHLEQEHLCLFKMTWGMHNRNLFRTICWEDTVIKSSLKSMLKGLTEGCNGCPIYAREKYISIYKDYVELTEEMTVMCVVWAETETLLEMFSHNLARNEIRARNLTQEIDTFQNEKFFWHQQIGRFSNNIPFMSLYSSILAEEADYQAHTHSSHCCVPISQLKEIHQPVQTDLPTSSPHTPPPQPRQQQSPPQQQRSRSPSAVANQNDTTCTNEDTKHKRVMTTRSSVTSEKSSGGRNTRNEEEDEEDEEEAAIVKNLTSRPPRISACMEAVKPPSVPSTDSECSDNDDSDSPPLQIFERPDIVYVDFEDLPDEFDCCLETEDRETMEEEPDGKKKKAVSKITITKTTQSTDPCSAADTQNATNVRRKGNDVSSDNRGQDQQLRRDGGSHLEIESNGQNSCSIQHTKTTADEDHDDDSQYHHENQRIPPPQPPLSPPSSSPPCNDRAAAAKPCTCSRHSPTSCPANTRLKLNRDGAADEAVAAVCNGMSFEDKKKCIDDLINSLITLAPRKTSSSHQDKVSKSTKDDDTTYNAKNSSTSVDTSGQVRKEELKGGVVVQGGLVNTNNIDEKVDESSGKKQDSSQFYEDIFSQEGRTTDNNGGDVDGADLNDPCECPVCKSRGLSADELFPPSDEEDNSDDEDDDYFKDPLMLFSGSDHGSMVTNPFLLQPNSPHSSSLDVFGSRKLVFPPFVPPPLPLLLPHTLPDQSQLEQVKHERRQQLSPRGRGQHSQEQDWEQPHPVGTVEEKIEDDCDDDEEDNCSVYDDDVDFLDNESPLKGGITRIEERSCSFAPTQEDKDTETAAAAESSPHKADLLLKKFDCRIEDITEILSKLRTPVRSRRRGTNLPTTSCDGNEDEDEEADVYEMENEIDDMFNNSSEGGGTASADACSSNSISVDEEVLKKSLTEYLHKMQAKKVAAEKRFKEEFSKTFSESGNGWCEKKSVKEQENEGQQPQCLDKNRSANNKVASDIDDRKVWDGKAAAAESAVQEINLRKSGERNVRDDIADVKAGGGVVDNGDRGRDEKKGTAPYRIPIGDVDSTSEISECESLNNSSSDVKFHNNSGGITSKGAVGVLQEKIKAQQTQTQGGQVNDDFSQKLDAGFRRIRIERLPKKDNCNNQDKSGQLKKVSSEKLSVEQKNVSTKEVGNCKNSSRRRTAEKLVGVSVESGSKDVTVANKDKMVESTCSGGSINVNVKKNVNGDKGVGDGNGNGTKSTSTSSSSSHLLKKGFLNNLSSSKSVTRQQQTEAAAAATASSKNSSNSNAPQSTSSPSLSASAPPYNNQEVKNTTKESSCKDNLKTTATQPPPPKPFPKSRKDANKLIAEIKNMTIKHCDKFVAAKKGAGSCTSESPQSAAVEKDIINIAAADSAMKLFSQSFSSKTSSSSSSCSIKTTTSTSSSSTTSLSAKSISLTYIRQTSTTVSSSNPNDKHTFSNSPEKQHPTSAAAAVNSNNNTKRKLKRYPDPKTPDFIRAGGGASNSSSKINDVATDKPRPAKAQHANVNNKNSVSSHEQQHGSSTKVNNHSANTTCTAGDGSSSGNGNSGGGSHSIPPPPNGCKNTDRCHCFLTSNSCTSHYHVGGGGSRGRDDGMREKLRKKLDGKLNVSPKSGSNTNHSGGAKGATNVTEGANRSNKKVDGGAEKQKPSTPSPSKVSATANAFCEKREDKSAASNVLETAAASLSATEKKDYQNLLKRSSIFAAAANEGEKKQQLDVSSLSVDKLAAYIEGTDLDETSGTTAANNTASDSVNPNKTKAKKSKNSAKKRKQKEVSQRSKSNIELGSVGAADLMADTCGGDAAKTSLPPSRGQVTESVATKENLATRSNCGDDSVQLKNKSVKLKTSGSISSAGRQKRDSVVDTEEVFKPRDNLEGLDEGEKELEMFKRFCMDAKPCSERPRKKICLNLKDINKNE